MQKKLGNINNDLVITEPEKLEKSEKEDKTERSALIKISLAPLQMKDSILVKTLSFGLNGLFFSAYIVGNSKLLALLGDEFAGAAALISPYQSVILGTSVGFVLSTGFEVGTSIGKKKYIKAGDIGKTAWILAISLGAISSLLMLGTGVFFPFLFEKKTAEAAYNFFTGCSIGNIPMLLLVANMQIAFQEGDWYIPPIVALALFVLANACSYFLAFTNSFGAFGVGLGGSIVQWILAASMQIWFLKVRYKKYHFYQLSKIPKFNEKIKTLLNYGWQLSLQRLSEWGNLMLLTTIIGYQNNEALKAAGPSAQYIGLLAASLQGVGQATGMLVARNLGAYDDALKLENISESKGWHKKNISTLLLNNAAGILVSIGIALGFYFASEPLVKFFLADETESATVELAQTLLCINMLGLIPDAIRIISSGGLRGWKDILYPTIVSLVMMSVIGSILGFGIGKSFAGDKSYDDQTAWMFYFRDISMFIAASIILNRCRSRILTDGKKTASQVNTNSTIKTSVQDIKKTNFSLCNAVSFLFKSNLKKTESYEKNITNDTEENIYTNPTMVFAFSSESK